MNKFSFIAVTAMLVGLATQSADAQNIAVVSGNGQVLTIQSLLTQGMTVQVTDANGAPLGSTSVTFTVVSGGFGGYFNSGSVSGNQTTVTTDVNGLATAFYILPPPPQLNVGSPYYQTVISAVPAGSSNNVSFTFTQLVANPTSPFSPNVYFAQTVLPDSLKGPSGTVNATSFKFQVRGYNGLADLPIPNATVELLNLQDPSTGPALACGSPVPVAGSSAGVNTVLSDSNGFVTCTPRFGGQPGSGQAAVTAGGVPSAASTPSGFWQLDPRTADPTNPLPVIQTSHIEGPYSFSVTAGSASSITVTQGGTQNANPGQTLTVPLTAKVADASGNPQSGVPVNWTVSPVGAANLAATTTSSGTDGSVVNYATISSNAAAGVVTITAALASDPTKKAVFTVTVGQSITIIGFTKYSGDNQSATVNTAFAQPLVVQVTPASAGVAVQFQVTSGSVTLSSTSATTDANGRAQVSATAGSAQGSANVVASVTGVGSQTFNLTVGPPPSTITAANFVNGADLQPNSFSPCSIGALVASAGTLSVANLSPTFPGLTVPSSALKIAFGGINAPILNIANNAKGQQQVTFQVPCEVPTGTSSVTVTGASSAVNLNIQAASPGIFQTQSSDGVLRTVLVRPDGSFVSLENPARRGEFEVAFVTGLGATSPPVGTLSVPAPGTTAAVQGSVIVGMAGGGIPLNYAQLSPDLPGVYAVSFQIPSDMSTGNNVSFSIGLVPQGSSTAVYSATVKVPVQ